MVLTEYNPSGSRPNFFGRQHLTFDKGGKCDSVFRGIVRSGGHGEVMWVLLKNYGFTAGHHFDEYRKLNIKNPLFIANGGFLCWKIL